MNLSQFLHFVRGGEKSNVDFKLACNAFNRSARDQEKAKAELVKDICAMANNGVSTSYLIIGVGDDRKTVQSVSDPNLSSQNIQSLVRDSIHPRPAVRVHRATWADAPMPFAGIEFVVIQVGPNARQAFRLARDSISWTHKYHFRKHEVWVRNEDTSDLATPEQIARLLGRGRMAQVDAEPSFKVIEYQKLARTDQLNALALDVRSAFEEMSGKLAPIARTPGDEWPENRRHFRVRLRIRGKQFVFRCVFLQRLASSQDNYFGLPGCWMCEHGVIVFVIGSFSDAGKFRWLSVDLRARWGSLGLLAPEKHVWFSRDLPESFAETSFSILTLPKLGDTKRLRESIGQLFGELETDDILFNHLDHARRLMDVELRRWSRKSPAALTKAFPSYSTERVVRFGRQLASVLNLMRVHPKNTA